MEEAGDSLDSVHFETPVMEVVIEETEVIGEGRFNLRDGVVREGEGDVVSIHELLASSCGNVRHVDVEEGWGQDGCLGDTIDQLTQTRLFLPESEVEVSVANHFSNHSHYGFARDDVEEFEEEATVPHSIIGS